MISYDPRITIQWNRRVRSGGRVAYGKPINFAGMKKICMFVASYIQSGRVFCLFVAGIFYALTLHIHGFVPPCGALMRPLPLWCRTTGKAEPFFHFRPTNIFGYVQHQRKMFEWENYTQIKPSSSRHERIHLFEVSH